jgi:hypothetical protein
MPTEPPFIGALIRLDGTDVDFLQLLGGIDLADLDKVRETGHILDLKYFTPV